MQLYPLECIYNHYQHLHVRINLKPSENLRFEKFFIESKVAINIVSTWNMFLNNKDDNRCSFPINLFFNLGLTYLQSNLFSILELLNYLYLSHYTSSHRKNKILNLAWPQYSIYYIIKLAKRKNAFYYQAFVRCIQLE